MTAKRAFDLAASLLGLVVLAPVMALVAIAIRLDSPGPALFRHQRVGKNFERFDVLKFRTMRGDATGPQVTFDGDDRYTRVGHFLRRTKLDELPQLINVVRGEMSLVGPRPEVSEWVEAYRDDFARILTVRPGITDPASIEYRRESETLAQAPDPVRAYAEEILPHKLELSTEYVQNQSMLGDLRIIVRTIFS